MTRRREPALGAARDQAGREVAVLADGPWARHCYWRDDLEGMQAATRAKGYPDQHPSAQHRGYQPTEDYEPAAGPDTDAPRRLWRYQPPAATAWPAGVPQPARRPDPTGTPAAPVVAVPVQRDRDSAQAQDTTDRARLHLVWAADQHEHSSHEQDRTAGRVDEGSLW
ncbi:hypothetical protein [Pseudonocardia sp. GCM10023141]|uniref:hypothetical protein n=1 Tax=Pseudonocardia sp. GCM10023141 TaxID=3252653 RepID=UPI003609F3D7